MAVNRMLQPAKSPWSANPACVTIALKTATRSTQSQPKKIQRCPEKSTQDSSKKVNASRSSVNILTSVLVPMCTAFQNRSLHQFSASLYQVLTKVNAGQTSVETLTTVNSSFFLAAVIRPYSHVWTEIASKELILNQKRRRCVMRWVKWSPTLTVYISIMEVCDTSTGGVKP